MKVLDKYITKNFLVGYLIVFMVLMGLCVVLDLFVNLDEFTEKEELGPMDVIKDILTYYGVQIPIYFRNFAGMITVIAAVFSLGKMIHKNEFVAIMASGVSLKRVIAPVVVLSILLTSLLVIDQEIVIPRLANRIIRSHDAVQGGESFNVWFMGDSKGSLICTPTFDATPPGTMLRPTIMIREPIPDSVEWKMIGKIFATKAIYNAQMKGWDLTDGVYTEINRDESEFEFGLKPLEVKFYESDLTPTDIPMRRQEGYKGLLSSAQLGALDRDKQRFRVKDQADLYSQKNFRITDPIINIIMLLVALPVLVCRDPKTMKSAIMISFAMTTSCFIMTQLCKMMASEVIFNQVRPELWAWAPVIIFFPIAVFELDSMKT